MLLAVYQNKQLVCHWLGQIMRQPLLSVRAYRLRPTGLVAARTATNWLTGPKCRWRGLDFPAGRLQPLTTVLLEHLKPHRSQDGR